MANSLTPVSSVSPKPPFEGRPTGAWAYPRVKVPRCSPAVFVLHPSLCSPGHGVTVFSDETMLGKAQVGAQALELSEREP